MGTSREGRPRLRCSSATRCMPSTCSTTGGTGPGRQLQRRNFVAFDSRPGRSPRWTSPSTGRSVASRPPPMEASCSSATPLEDKRRRPADSGQGTHPRSTTKSTQHPRRGHANSLCDRARPTIWLIAAGNFTGRVAAPGTEDHDGPNLDHHQRHHGQGRQSAATGPGARRIAVSPNGTRLVATERRSESTARATAGLNAGPSAPRARHPGTLTAAPFRCDLYAGGRQLGSARASNFCYVRRLFIVVATSGRSTAPTGLLTPRAGSGPTMSAPTPRPPGSTRPQRHPLHVRPMRPASRSISAPTNAGSTTPGRGCRRSRRFGPPGMGALDPTTGIALPSKQAVPRPRRHRPLPQPTRAFNDDDGAETRHKAPRRDRPRPPRHRLPAGHDPAGPTVAHGPVRARWQPPRPRSALPPRESGAFQCRLDSARFRPAHHPHQRLRRPRPQRPHLQVVDSDPLARRELHRSGEGHRSMQCSELRVLVEDPGFEVDTCGSNSDVTGRHAEPSRGRAAAAAGRPRS